MLEQVAQEGNIAKQRNLRNVHGVVGLDDAANRDAMANPDALDALARLADNRPLTGGRLLRVFPDARLDVAEERAALD